MVGNCQINSSAFSAPSPPQMETSGSIFHLIYTPFHSLFPVLQMNFPLHAPTFRKLHSWCVSAAIPLSYARFPTSLLGHPLSATIPESDPLTSTVRSCRSRCPGGAKQLMGNVPAMGLSLGTDLQRQLLLGGAAMPVVGGWHPQHCWSNKLPCVWSQEHLCGVLSLGHAGFNKSTPLSAAVDKRTALV